MDVVGCMPVVDQCPSPLVASAMVYVVMQSHLKTIAFVNNTALKIIIVIGDVSRNGPSSLYEGAECLLPIHATRFAS